jgi:hypothetical protein
MRWSSGFGTRLGEEGHCVDGGPEVAKGDGLGCHPWARMSAEVCRRAKLLGGGSIIANGCGPGGGGGACGLREDEVDDGVVPAPIDPYGLLVESDRFEGTGGRWP